MHSFVRCIFTSALIAVAATGAQAGTPAPLVLAVHHSVPADTLQKLRELAGEQPGALTIANVGRGSPSRSAAKRFESAAQLSLAHVNYKDARTAKAALASGEVAAMFLPASQAASLISAGRVKALAVTGKRRYAALPEVPTFTESGLPGVR